jgi:hypothetical protein
MDCRNFEELLDSYFCGELAVETNHAMLRHVEHCGECRDEMAARRALRESLRRACSRERMSEQAIGNLHARLHAEAGLRTRDEEPTGGAIRPGWLARLFEIRFLAPIMATAAIILLAAGSWSLYVLHREPGTPNLAIAHSEQNRALELSDGLVFDTAEDHRICAAKFLNSTGPVEMPESVREYDPACVGLDKVAAVGAQGLVLRSAHVCGVNNRRFAHLVYTRDERLVSLLVTGRDNRALKISEVPPFDGLSIGFQQAETERLAMSAYQTNKRIVLIVSDLPEEDNSGLAERLAGPVIAHLRSAEIARVAPGAGETPALPGAGETPALPGAGETPALPGAGGTPALPGAGGTPALQRAALQAVNLRKLIASLVHI